MVATLGTYICMNKVLKMDEIRNNTFSDHCWSICDGPFQRKMRTNEF